MDVIKEKIRVMSEKLKELTVLDSEKIEVSYVECDAYKKNNNPPDINAPWKSVTSETYFEGIDSHCWLHMCFKTSKASWENNKRQEKLSDIKAN